MPLSDFCNRLTNTCTQHGPSDSRACAVPKEPLAGRSRLRHRSAFSRWTSSRSTDGASLDGDPPASAIAHDPLAARARSLSPERPRRRGHHAVLAELRSVAPPRRASRSRRFRPRTGLVMWPLTPSVATRGPQPRPLPRKELKTASAVPPGPPRAAASSKTAELAGPGRLPSPMDPSRGSLPFRTASLPSVPAGSLPHARGDSPRTPRRYRREQATTPLHPFARSKSPSARGRTAPEGCPPVREAWGLDPCPKAWTRRRSSISATRTAREHNR
jgi:hypothetical protein